MIGSVVGNFKILEKIGEGGMGTVFLGLDLMLDRRVALKMLRPELSGEPGVVERFRSEAVTLARICHPRVAMLYSFLRERDDFFMVMEYVAGRSLDRELEHGGRMSCERAIPLFCQALEGVDHAHRLGIIHRDLKPANLMLLEDDSVKVMDFGIARVLGTSRMTRTGRLVGTIEYMSPEQVRVRETDARSDIYSLAIVLYEMLTGRVPFQRDSEYELMRSHVEEVPPPPREFAHHIPPTIEAAILRALSKSPEDRFATAGEFRRVLLEGLPAAAASAAQNASAAPALDIKKTRLADAPRIEIDRPNVVMLPARGNSEARMPPSEQRPRKRLIENWAVVRLYLAGFGLLAAGGLVALLLLRAPSPPPTPAASGQPQPVRQSSPPPAAVTSPPPALTAVEPARVSSQPDPAEVAAEERERERRRRLAERAAKKRAAEKALDLQ
jgi:serine/threonine-protein kinase